MSTLPASPAVEIRRPPSVLSAQQRQARVEIIRAQIDLMRRYGTSTGDTQHARWLLKEVIYRVWEQPQIPVPRFDKYSLWFPWSPRAMERLDGYVKGGRRPNIVGLRLEHLIPRGILAEELLRHTPVDLAAFLDNNFRGIVVTTDDDAQLNAAGVRARMPEGWTFGTDPWVRYEAAGFRKVDFLVPCAARPELA